MREETGKMTNNPMRQADIERRLANMAKAPRCGARTRIGRPCRQAAVRGRKRCRMHGGAKGSGGPAGRRNGNFKHGLWTAESMLLRKETRAKARDLRRFLKLFGGPGGNSGETYGRETRWRWKHGHQLRQNRTRKLCR